MVSCLPTALRYPPILAAARARRLAAVLLCSLSQLCLVQDKYVATAARPHGVVAGVEVAVCNCFSTPLISLVRQEQLVAAGLALGGLVRLALFTSGLLARAGLRLVVPLVWQHVGKVWPRRVCTHGCKVIS